MIPWGPPESTTQTVSRWVSHLCRAHGCDRMTDVTDRQCYLSVTIGHIYYAHSTAMWFNNNNKTINDNRCRHLVCNACLPTQAYGRCQSVAPSGKSRWIMRRIAHSKPASLYLTQCVKTWRYPQNRKHITYCTVFRGRMRRTLASSP